MLSSTSPRELFLLALPFLLGICLPSLWSPPFPLHATAMILSLSRQGAALTHLDSLPPHDLVLWTDGSVHFPFGKISSGILANCSLCDTEDTHSFSAGSHVQVFLLKSAPFCTLSAGLGTTNKSAISHRFSFYLALVLSSPPCPLFYLSFYLKRCGRFGRNCLLSPPVLSGYNGSPDTRFSGKTTWLISWPDGERYLRPPQSFVVSHPYFSYPLLYFLGLEVCCLI